MRIRASKFALTAVMVVIALAAGCSKDSGSSTGGSPTGRQSASPAKPTPPSITKFDDVCKSATPAEVEAIAHVGINSLMQESTALYDRPNVSCIYTKDDALEFPDAVVVKIYEGEFFCSDGAGGALPLVPYIGEYGCGRPPTLFFKTGKLVVEVNTDAPGIADKMAVLEGVAKLVVPRLEKAN